MTPSPHSSVAYQVMWNRMIAIVEEQAQALIRTAFSTSVREAGDLSAGVYDTQGSMLAQAVTGTPGHVNAMAAAVRHFIRHIGISNMADGDVYITNDPWKGTGHLHDITVVSPSFYRGRLVGFFACTAHIVDIGGRGFGADANSIYEEGLYIPIMKLFNKGDINRTLIQIIKANVREPDQVIGDIYALSTCNLIGHARLINMLEEFAITDINAVAVFILENSKKATVEHIAKLAASAPINCATGEMTIDGYHRPIHLKVKITIESDKTLCDFSGTSPIDKKGINVPLVYTQAYSCYALKCAIAPEVPNNEASLAPFIITAPEGCILNAPHPAAVALRHVTGQMLPDTIYDALHKIMPNQIPAEGSSALCNFQLALRPRTDTDKTSTNTRRAEVLTFNSGGAGARAKLDGMNTTAFPSGVMTMPVEATEHTGPVIIWRKELRPDSGGAGEYRGGLGQLMDIGAADGYEFDFSAMFDRVHHPARGRHGGHNGAPTVLIRDDGEIIKGKGRQFIPAGRKVMLSFAGGGGYGNPKDRALQKIREDIAGGYISIQAAKEYYGFDDNMIKEILEEVKKGSFVK